MSSKTKVLIGAVLLVGALLLACGQGGIATAPTATPVVVPVTFQGRGDAVIECGDLSDYTKVRLAHSGSRNFIVWPYDGDNDRHCLLVNEIGAYKGTVKWDRRTRSLEITADGSWTITVSR